MEPSKKSRSSILKVGGSSGKDEANAASEITSRLRRISFSGKKSIRVFSGEDEAKTWDNSYEISDTHTNTSEEEKCVSGLVDVHQRRIALRNRRVIVETEPDSAKRKARRSSEPVLEKENIFPSTNSLNSNNESLYFVNTMEYIDKLQHSAVPCIENSTDVSLLDREKVCDLPSYSLCETERKAMLRAHTSHTTESTEISNNVIGEKTALCIKECQETTRREYTVVYSSPVEFPKNEQAEKSVRAYLANENKQKSMAELVYESPKLKDRTHLSCSDMEISYLESLNKPQNVNIESSPINMLEKSNECVDMNLTDPAHTEKALDSSPFLSKTIDITSANKQHKYAFVADDSAKEERLLPQKRKTTIFADDGMDVSTYITSQEAVPPLREVTLIKTLTKSNGDESSAKKSSVIVTHKVFARNFRAQVKVHTEDGNEEKGREEKPTVEPPAANTCAISELGGADNISDLSLSPWSSPLIPPEYMAQLPHSDKKPTLRQLNDAITRGEINIFPEDMAMSAAEIRQQQIGDRDRSRKKCRGTLDFGIQMQISQAAEHNKTQATGDECFEDTDMVLDDTSFFTKVKLGDETSSKNSATQSSKRETMHFNTGVDETLNADNLVLSSSIYECERPTNLPGDRNTNNGISINNTTFNKLDRVSIYDAGMQIAVGQTDREVADVEYCASCIGKNSVTAVLCGSKHNDGKNKTNTFKLTEARAVNYANDVDRRVDRRETILDERDMHLSDVEKTSIVTNSDEQITSSTELIDAETYVRPKKIPSCTKINAPMTSLVKMNTHNKDILHTFESVSQEQTICDETFPKVHSVDRKTTYGAPTWEGTPHRSIIEFEYLERQIEAEDAQNNTKKLSIVNPSPRIANKKLPIGSWGRSPLSTSINILKNRFKKRLISNLTPQSSLSKKRQTILFDDCNLDESSDSEHPIEKPKKATTENMQSRQTNLFSENMDLDHRSGSHKSILYPVQHGTDESKGVNEQDKQNSTFLAEATLELEDISAKEQKQESLKEPAVLHASFTLNETNAGRTPPSLRTKDSRIPVLITSARKEKEMASHYTSSLEGSTFHNSMHSIEILRRAGNCAGQKEPTVAILPDETLNINHSMPEPTKPVFGDNTIVISDVSMHYQSLKRPAITNSSVTSPAFKTKRIVSPVLRDEGTAHGMTKFAQNYINLTDYSLLNGWAEDNIDQTHLSLVSTLLDVETVVEGHRSPVALEDEAQLECGMNMDVRSDTNNVNQHSLCRKCKRCQDTILNNTASTSADSFILPPTSPLKPMETHLERLRNLRKRPTIVDVSKHFQKVSLELTHSNASLSVTVSGGFFKSVEEEDPLEKVNAFIKSYKIKKESTRKKLELKGLARYSDTFVDLLKQFQIEYLSKWTIDCQLQLLKTIIFSHHKLMGFRIRLQYKEEYAPNYTFDVTSLKVQKSSCFGQKSWLPIDYLMEFQRKLEFPIDLLTLSENRDKKDAFSILRKADEICKAVAKLGIDLWRIVCAEKAVLIRNGKTILARKTVRIVTSDDGQAPHVNKTVFTVEIHNIKKLCFKDIVSPPLHLFEEKIELLPTGLDFLQTFLRNPSIYLK